LFYDFSVFFIGSIVCMFIIVLYYFSIIIIKARDFVCMFVIV